MGLNRRKRDGCAGAHCPCAFPPSKSPPRSTDSTPLAVNHLIAAARNSIPPAICSWSSHPLLQQCRNLSPYPYFLSLPIPFYNTSDNLPPSDYMGREEAHGSRPSIPWSLHRLPPLAQTWLASWPPTFHWLQLLLAAASWLSVMSRSLSAACSGPGKPSRPRKAGPPRPPRRPGRVQQPPSKARELLHRDTEVPARKPSAK